MANTAEGLNDIAKAIQLALGPVFLLTGVAGMLNVMSGRLSRIIDRGRNLTEKPVLLDKVRVATELTLLERRRNIISKAINMCTISALLICLVVVCLFLEVMLSIPLYWLIGALFTMATLSLVAGLAYFLREVHFASRSVKLIRFQIFRIDEKESGREK